MSDVGAGLGHEGAWELLPWFVNGTLAGQERRRVEGHLATCGECQQETERCRRLGELVRAGGVSPSPHPAHLAAVLRRIDETEQRPPRGRRQPWAGNPRFVRRVLLAQAACILMLLALSIWPSRQPSRPTFRTLGDPPAAAHPGRQVRVVFTPEARESEIRRLLLDVHGELAGGPSPLGAYSVRLPASGPGAEPLGLVLEHLRADPRVRFAEPVAEGSPVP